MVKSTTNIPEHNFWKPVSFFNAHFNSLDRKAHLSLDPTAILAFMMTIAHSTSSVFHSECPIWGQVLLEYMTIYTVAFRGNVQVRRNVRRYTTAITFLIPAAQSRPFLLREKSGSNTAFNPKAQWLMFRAKASRAYPALHHNTPYTLVTGILDTLPSLQANGLHPIWW